MKLEKWALIAEIIGGVSVVVTLIFLIIGIRENTAVTRASMYANSIWELNETERNVLSNPELSRIWRAFEQLETSELSEDDLQRLRRNLLIVSRTYDTVHSMNSYGLLGENEWGRFEFAICRVYENAESAGLVDIYVTIASRDFKRFIEETC